jgi:SAM-dependent methyltransferase
VAKKFDLVQSSYALYYSPQRMSVLDVMRNHLKHDGRLAVFTPNAPHGMVDFVAQYSEIPQGVTECMVFGPNVLEKYFRKNFWEVTIHLFHNVVRILTVTDFLEFYKSTTYFNSEAEEKICADVQRKIDKYGFFEFEKNGYLIIGQNKI